MDNGGHSRVLSRGVKESVSLWKTHLAAGLREDCYSSEGGGVGVSKTGDKGDP